FRTEGVYENPFLFAQYVYSSLLDLHWIYSEAENQRKYAENDSRFKSSKVLKELLEKSKQNKEKNEREIQDKYCLRGAEWGVGDCSTVGMTDQEKEDFITELRKRVGE
uniref:Uncharacterized protein n=1 Tax=Aegilops tauschii subsp. strangulata TaxID=200361 RepID=A0A453IP33_AEGTS